KSVYKDRDYANAQKAFQNFLDYAPHDPRAGEVRVLNELAGVQSLAVGASPNWTTVIEASREMVKKVGSEPAYRSSYNQDLGDVVLPACIGLAKKAKATADPAHLADVDAAITLHDRVAGKAAVTARGKS